jgi:hypothetical protein
VPRRGVRLAREFNEESGSINRCPYLALTSPSAPGQCSINGSYRINAGSAFHLERFLRLAEATMIDPRKETGMSRISTPATIDAAPAASRPLLEGVKKQLGVVPNMFRLIANSPGALGPRADQCHQGHAHLAHGGRIAPLPRTQLG